jgi:hypothetical protein
MLLVYQDYHFTLQRGIEASGRFEAFHDLPHPASASDVLFRDRGSVELRARHYHAASQSSDSQAPVRPGPCQWNTEKSSFTCISSPPGKFRFLTSQQPLERWTINLSGNNVGPQTRIATPNALRRQNGPPASQRRGNRTPNSLLPRHPLVRRAPVSTEPHHRPGRLAPPDKHRWRHPPLAHPQLGRGHTRLHYLLRAPFLFLFFFFFTTTGI